MRAGKVVILIVLVVLEVGCGLPSPYYLSPPSVSSLFGQFTLSCTFQNANRSQDYEATFQGFELYYKFFGNTTDSTFLADQQYGTTSYTPTDLVNSHGFHRVTLGSGTGGLTPDSTPGNSSAPLINIASLDSADLATSFSITITFNAGSSDAGAQSLFTLNGSNTPPYPFSYYHFGPATGATGVTQEIYEEIRRFVAIDSSQGSSGCKFFANNTSATYYGPDYLSGGADSDVGSTVYNNSQSGKLIVMMYAAAYGHAENQVVYSTPTYLGWTQINAFN